MFYFNTITRETESFLNPLDGSGKQVDPPELLNDYDSIAETTILIEYLNKYATSGSDIVVGVSRLITQKLATGSYSSLMALRK